MSDNFILGQNYPNPFNSQTLISFEIATRGNYLLEIFDTKGSRVRELFNGLLNPGRYEIDYDAGTLSSGVYLYRLYGANKSLTRKMILLR